jgi:hypothetical protein
MKVYPVVHVISPEQAVEQTEIAINAGSDGVFLIDHGGGSHHIVDAYNAVAKVYPETFIGLNYLTENPVSGYKLTQSLLDSGEINRAPDAIWFDDATRGTRERNEVHDNLGHLALMRENDLRLKNIKMLGGVAFKYTPDYTADSEEAAAAATELAPLIDVVTTSGEGTGKPPTTEKIAAMKHAIGEQELAVASGIDINNIADFKGNVDIVLIASSLETKPYSGVFVPEKVKAFIDAAKDR